MTAALHAQTSPFRASDGSASLMDYCLLPYPVAPRPDALSARTMLAAGFAAMGTEDAGERLCDRIAAQFGPHRTVFGVARDHGTSEVRLELYFYRRPHSPVSLADVIALLAPDVEVRSALPDGVAWHMVSVELGAAHLRGNLPAIARLYSDATGLSYAVDGANLVLENRYDFHDPRRDIDAILEGLRASLHAPDNATTLRDRLPPQLMDAYHVCVAQKRSADAVYFSRVSGPALQWFLERHGWTGPVLDRWREHGERMAHIRWDVGFSYQRAGDGIAITKSGWYASF